MWKVKLWRPHWCKERLQWNFDIWYGGSIEILWYSYFLNAFYELFWDLCSTFRNNKEDYIFTKTIWRFIHGSNIFLCADLIRKNGSLYAFFNNIWIFPDLHFLCVTTKIVLLKFDTKNLEVRLKISVYFPDRIL